MYGPRNAQGNYPSVVSDEDYWLISSGQEHFSQGIATGENGLGYHSFIASEPKEIIFKKAELSVDIEKTDNMSTFIYSWCQLKTKPEKDSKVNEVYEFNSGNKSLIVTEPGWYKLNISSNMNRRTETQSSIVCRALPANVEPPKIKVKSILVNGVETDFTNNRIELSGQSTIKITVESEVETNGLDKNLVSDSIKY